MRELRNVQDEVKRTIRVGLDESNGDASASSKGGAADPPVTGGAGAPDATIGQQSSTPTVGSAPTPDEVRDITRSLGRSLGQIRRAKEEVQRSFRLDLEERKAPGRAKPTGTPQAGPAATPQPDPRELGPTDDAPDDPSS